MATSSLSLASTIKLANGLTMPRIHLGVYLTSGEETFNAVTYALEAGYRAIDSAQMYNNEREAGSAIRAFLDKNPDLNRSSIHFTTKLASSSMSYKATRSSIRESIKACGLEYIDLFLLHSPYGGRAARLKAWRAVCDAVKEGEIRSAGVSNYGIRHLQEVIEASPDAKPIVNQLEVHPWNTHEDICDFCKENDIVIEAYAPLVRAMRMSHPILKQLSEKYGKTPAQILVRWSLQRGYVSLPKSVDKARIAENADVEGFEIEEADIVKLAQCDEGLVTDWDPLDAP